MFLKVSSTHTKEITVATQNTPKVQEYSQITLPKQREDIVRVTNTVLIHLEKTVLQGT